MLDLTFSFTSESKIPYYEQLYQFVRQEIESGRIVAATQLPSIRALSDSLKISKTTVEEAYQQLTAEGYISSKARVGYFSLPPEHTFIDSTMTNQKNSSLVVPRKNSSIDIQGTVPGYMFHLISKRTTARMN